MDFDVYQSRLWKIEAEAEELRAQIRKLKNELDEAETARNSANKLRSEFDGFVLGRKNAKNRSSKNPVLKAFQSFTEKANSLLTGDSYHKSNANVEEMKRVAEQKIRRYQEDISYCEKELKRLNRERDTLNQEYQAENARQEAQNQ